jgi:hypothetical protein
MASQHGSRSDFLLKILEGLDWNTIGLCRRMNTGGRLNHYTSLATLPKILEKNDLWLTDVEYCNDTTEVLHGRELVTHVISEVSKGHSGDRFWARRVEGRHVREVPVKAAARDARADGCGRLARSHGLAWRYS